jgi:hypothetical protein
MPFDSNASAWRGVVVDDQGLAAIQGLGYAGHDRRVEGVVHVDDQPLADGGVFDFGGVAVAKDPLLNRLTAGPDG